MRGSQRQRERLARALPGFAAEATLRDMVAARRLSIHAYNDSSEGAGRFIYIALRLRGQVAVNEFPSAVRSRCLAGCG
jgi:hypothetical protein